VPYQKDPARNLPFNLPSCNLSRLGKCDTITIPRLLSRCNETRNEHQRRTRRHSRTSRNTTLKHSLPAPSFRDSVPRVEIIRGMPPLVEGNSTLILIRFVRQTRLLTDQVEFPSLPTWRETRPSDPRHLRDGVAQKGDQVTLRAPSGRRRVRVTLGQVARGESAHPSFPPSLPPCLPTSERATKRAIIPADYRSERCSHLGRRVSDNAGEWTGKPTPQTT